MIEWICPRCHHRHQTRDDIVRVQHTCPLNAGDPWPMERRGKKTYEVYCGNYDCPSRVALVTFAVPDDEFVDGEVWLCPNCREVVVDVGTELV